ncbi:phosphoglycerate mutase, partial [Sesbania bispinosa]
PSLPPPPLTTESERVRILQRRLIPSRSMVIRRRKKVKFLQRVIPIVPRLPRGVLFRGSCF